MMGLGVCVLLGDIAWMMAHKAGTTPGWEGLQCVPEENTYCGLTVCYKI